MEAYLYIPSHAALEQEASKTDVRAMSTGEDEPSWGQRIVEVLAGHGWRHQRSLLAEINVDVLPVSQFQENGILLETPYGQGMPAGPNG
jgi:hypothetical protein